MDAVTYALANSQAKKQIEAAVDPFIVTLTPTAQDYSGTMDKTISEIQAAYNAGKNIVFRVLTSQTTYVNAPCAFASNLGFTYMDFGATIILPSNDIMIAAETHATNDGTKATYKTTVYTLTRAS